MDRIIMPFLLFAVSVGLVFSYIVPTYDVVIALQEQEARIDSTIQKTTQYQDKIDELTVKLDNIPVVDRDRLAQFLGNTKSDPVRMTALLDVLARRSNVLINNFDLPQGAINSVSGDVSWARYTITCSGTYSDLKLFILSMEHSLTLMELRSLGIVQTPKAEGQVTNELTATLVFDTPYLNTAP